MKKIKIKYIEYEGKVCVLVKSLGYSFPEWFITCKEGFDVLTKSGIIPTGGDRLGYTRTRCGKRIHNILLPTQLNMYVDHINRDRRDNRLQNLRLVTPKQNCQNGSVHSTNKLGIKYISWSNHASKYRVVVNSKHIGYYKELDDAIEKRNQYLLDTDHPYRIISK